MRLLNIKTGYLENIQINFKEKIRIKYICISHRWLKNEINLNNIGLINIKDKIFIGKHLLEDLKKNVNFEIDENMNNEKNIWNYYLNLKNINIENHNKLINIINTINNIKNNDIENIWLDTICIDKFSSTELSENIISMFKIYQKAEKVFVFMNDRYNLNSHDLVIDKNISRILENPDKIKIDEKIFTESYVNGINFKIENTNDIKNDIIDKIKKIETECLKFINDEWFSRAWTLQEVISNIHVDFYGSDFKYIINKKDIIYSKIFNIDYFHVQIYNDKFINIFTNFVIHEKIGYVLNWINDRESTIEEDKIYSLMGILDTYIPILYGEGQRNSIMRLLKEYIQKNSNDFSILDNLLIMENRFINFNFKNIKYNQYLHYNFAFLEWNLGNQDYDEEQEIIINNNKINLKHTYTLNIEKDLKKYLIDLPSCSTGEGVITITHPMSYMCFSDDPPITDKIDYGYIRNEVNKYLNNINIKKNNILSKNKHKYHTTVK